MPRAMFLVRYQAPVPCRGARRQCADALLAVLVVTLSFVVGCKVTKERVKEWGRQKDSGRLTRVVSDGKQKRDVRIEAAMQLVHIGRFFALEKGLKGAAKGDRQQIADAVADKLLPLLDSKGGDEAEMVRAKDGSFSAWYFATPKKRRLIEEKLIAWIIRGRHGDGHDHPIQKILDAFGRRGGNLLAEQVQIYDPNLFRWHPKSVVSPTCLLGQFWKRIGPGVRADTARRYMKAARANKKAALLNEGALLCAIGVLGRREGTRFLANLMATDKDLRMKAGAAVALRLAAAANPTAVDPDSRAAVVRELKRQMDRVNAGKSLDNPVFRGIGYLFHLLELVSVFQGKEIFRELGAVIAAPGAKLEDQEQRDKRTQLRLLIIGFLMRLDPIKALKIAYETLPLDEPYEPGYLNGTIFDNASYVWKKSPKLRPALLKALRSGLTSPSWLAKIIAVEGLALNELLPRKGVAADIAAIQKLEADQTKLLGADWKDATLGKRAKKAIEVLSKKK